MKTEIDGGDDISAIGEEKKAARGSEATPPPAIVKYRVNCRT